jgi:speckle-type POZ protein
MYDMERLKVICEDKLCRLIDVSSAGAMLLLAEQHRCRRLKEACFEFLSTSKTLNVGAATDGFQNLAKTFPFILFDLIAKLEAR